MSDDPSAFERGEVTKDRHHPNRNERRIVNKRETFRFGCEEFRPTRSCSRFANFLAAYLHKNAFVVGFTGL